MSAEERKLSVDGHVYRYGLVEGARCWYTGYSCKVAVDDETERLLAALSTAERERSELAAELSIARAECLTLAKLCADEPQFFNPLNVYAAKMVRDDVLASAALAATPEEK